MLEEKWRIEASKLYSFVASTNRSMCNKNVCVIKTTMVLVLSWFSCVWLCNPMDRIPPGSSVQGISRQEFWSGLPFPSPGDLSNPGIKPAPPALAGGFLTTEPPGVNQFIISPITYTKLYFPTSLTTKGIYQCFIFCPNSLARLSHSCINLHYFDS